MAELARRAGVAALCAAETECCAQTRFRLEITTGGLALAAASLAGFALLVWATSREREVLVTLADPHPDHSGGGPPAAARERSR